MRFVVVFGLIVLVACTKTTLVHERYIHNNTATDTIIVINPDFDDAIDTIVPGDTALVYKFEMLDNQSATAPCAWPSDTLIVKNHLGEQLIRSVKEEDFWTYTIQGTTDRRQQCFFIISTGDF
jgi:hypothetical protein